MLGAFVNYWSEPARESPLNLAAARTLLGVYLAWKVLSYEWQPLQEWPAHHMDPKFAPILFEATYSNLGLLAVATALVALVFAAGYRLRATSFLLAFGVSYLALHRYVYNSSGGTETMFFASYFVILLGLYAETDVLSLDGIREHGLSSRRELMSVALGETDRDYSMPALRWSLVIVGVLYFGSGFKKVVDGPVWAWVQPDTIARYITHRIEMYGVARPVGELIASIPTFSLLAAAGTIALEIGFLIAILAGVRRLLPIVLSLIAMHIVVALAIGPFFFDSIVFLLLFMAWDDGFAWLATATGASDALPGGLPDGDLAVELNETD